MKLIPKLSTTNNPTGIWPKDIKREINKINARGRSQGKTRSLRKEDESSQSQTEKRQDRADWAVPRHRGQADRGAGVASSSRGASHPVTGEQAAASSLRDFRGSYGA